MLRRLTLIALIALAAIDSMAATIRSAPPSIGSLAPDFRLVDQNGKSQTLSAARGKKVVLVFYRGYW